MFVNQCEKIQKLRLSKKFKKKLKTSCLDFDKKQVEIKQEYERKAEEAPTATFKAEILEAQKVELDGIFANYQTAIQEVVVTQVTKPNKKRLKGKLFVKMNARKSC